MVKIYFMRSYQQWIWLFALFTHGLSEQAQPRALPGSSPDNFMTVSVCRNSRKSIGCPDLKLLHIFTAFYGKFSGHDCDDPVLTARQQIPTCSSSNAAAVVRETCHGQQSCDLYGEDDLYKDPCPDVLKYLFVSYTCRGKADLPARLRALTRRDQKHFQVTAPANQIETATVCNGGAGSIVCPDLKIIKVRSAFYGKQQGRDCTGRLTRDEIPSCSSPNALTTIRDSCHGQQSCDLYADPNIYDPLPCPGVEKYLSVAYSCEGRAELEKTLNRFFQQKPGAPAARGKGIQDLGQYKLYQSALMQRQMLQQQKQRQMQQYQMEERQRQMKSSVQQMLLQNISQKPAQMPYV